MKRALNVLIGLMAGLVAGFIVSKIFLGPDWQDAFASPVVVGAVVGTAVAFQASRKKKK